MHIPADYEIKDAQLIERFVHKHPFAQLVCATSRFPAINHLPFLFDSDNQCLWGHLAKQNPDLKHLNNAPVSVVFSGPHGYISPDWYSKSGVPTWNYQAVHMQGICQINTTKSRIKNVVDELSTYHQNTRSLDWSNDYNPDMLSAIVAVKIDIQDTRCQFKLSQDRTIEDQQQVIKALEQNQQFDLANAMRNNS